MYNLKPLRKPVTPRNFATFDIESRNWIVFVVLGLFDGKQYREFRTMRGFINFLRDAPLDFPREIFAHYGGKFDFMFVLREAAKHKDLKIENFIPRGSSILSMDLVFNDKKFTLRDSSALLSFKLKTLTDSFDVPVKKGEWNHTKTKKWSKELSAYLKSDVLGLYQVLKKFESQPIIETSGMATTTASQALRVFRTHFLEREIFADTSKNKTESVEEFSRRAYFGGRTEIFRPLTKSPIYEYDVNSLYPYVMRENLFPVGAGFFTKTYRKNSLGIYRAIATVPKTEFIPCLGVMLKNKYLFPVGTFEGYWTSIEIEYAKSLGYDFKILNGVFFMESEKIFSRYINYFYDIRKRTKSDSVENITAKLMMNSLYGRFGLNPKKEGISYDLRAGVIPQYEVKVGHRTIEIYREEVELSTFSKVAIAAFVTAYARIYMHQKFYTPYADSLYYTDTDSIFVTRELPSGINLGEMKLVREYNEGACFLLPKTYVAKSSDYIKQVMKGFPKDKIKDFSLEDFEQALEGELKRLKVKIGPKFASFKQAIQKKKFLTMTDNGEKQLRSQYSKRIILKTKTGEYTTRPITIGE